MVYLEGRNLKKLGVFMKKKELFKKGIVSVYRLSLYVCLWGVFIYAFGDSYEGLQSITRTLVVTTGSFIFILFMMLNVYGNFEIGEKKSKPVVFSTFVNIFISDVFTLMTLKVMGVHQSTAWKNDLLIFLAIIVIQYLLIYAFTYFGNYVYFKMFNAKKIIIVHDNSDDIGAITKFFNRHKKQYEIVSVLNQKTVDNINLEGINELYLIDLEQVVVANTCMENFLSRTSIFFNTDIYSSLMGSQKKTVIDDILIYEFSSRKMTIYQQTIKRLIDVVVSVIALIVFSPLILVVGIAIKMDDNGPVFFKQERLTRDGEIFKIVKFRSMKLNSGDKPAQKNDDRITKVGHIIRKFRLDEIPQFINILKGDMSVVGPRPESVSINEEITEELPEFLYRLKVKAGLTGYAQIFGKYNTTPKKKLLLDLEYIENFSIIQDIKLIFQTFIVFVKKDSTEGFDADEDSVH